MIFNKPWEQDGSHYGDLPEFKDGYELMCLCDEPELTI